MITHGKMSYLEIISRLDNLQRQVDYLNRRQARMQRVQDFLRGKPVIFDSGYGSAHLSLSHCSDSPSDRGSCSVRYVITLTRIDPKKTCESIKVSDTTIVDCTRTLILEMERAKRRHTIDEDTSKLSAAIVQLQELVEDLS